MHVNAHESNGCCCSSSLVVRTDEQLEAWLHGKRSKLYLVTEKQCEELERHVSHEANRALQQASLIVSISKRLRTAWHCCARM